MLNPPLDQPPTEQDAMMESWAVQSEHLAEIGRWLLTVETGNENWSPGLLSLLNVPSNQKSPRLFDFVPALEKEVSFFLASKLPFCRHKFVHRSFTDAQTLLFLAEKRYDGDGRVTHVLATLQNISDMVWTFGVPGMGDQLLQAIVSCEDVIIASVNTALLLNYVDGEGWEKIGVVAEDLIGTGLRELLEEKHSEIVRAFETTLSGKSMDMYVSLRDHFYAVKIRPLFGPEGNIVGAIAFGIDITDHNLILESLERGRMVLEETVLRRTKELRASQLTLQSILTTSNVGIMIADMNHTILYANAACYELVGGEKGTLVGRSFRDFLSPTLEKGLLQAQADLKHSSEETSHFRRQIPLRKQDGSEIRVDVHAAVCSDETGTPTQLVAVISDVTEQHRYLNELKEAKLISEAANRAKSQFLAHMSHEIRTPLNGVIGLSDLLMGTNLTTKQQEYAGLINVSGKSLLFLINDILDFSKIEAGKLEIEEDEFDLIATVESVLGILATRASDKGLELCGSFSSDIPRFVRGDSGRLRQVLINLVGNALKFTVQGGVKLQVVTEKIRLAEVPCDDVAMDDRIVIRFSVVDTGIGIPEQQISKLFQSFSQIDNTASRRHDGSGLGLAISKRLVELMKGDLQVRSIEGEGSVFWFTLPFSCRIDIKSCPAQFAANSGGPVPECPRMGGTRCPLGHRKVMHGKVTLSDRSAIVVDDNEVQRSTLAEQLESWGMDVSQASFRQEAITMLVEAALAGKPYQLAIVDSSIADGEGMDLVEAMKNDGRLQETAIILLTPLTVDTDVAVIHSAGVSMHISKPVFSSSLFDATITALFSMGQSKTADPADEDGADEGPVYEGFDERRSLVKILVAEDNRINQIVVRDTLENVGFQCRVVDNGLKAVEALATESFDAVLMDCQMPEMDGFEATKMIRKNESVLQSQPHRLRIPIIALTANATKDDEARCLECGMDAYCSKPINPKSLVRTLDHWVRSVLLKRIRDGAEGPVAPFPIKTFLMLCGRNKLIATMVLSDFLNQVPRDLKSIEQAVLDNDNDKAVDVLRHLRGKAGLLGAESLEKQTLDLENHCLTRVGDAEDLLDRLFREANNCIQHAMTAKQKILDDAL